MSRLVVYKDYSNVEKVFGMETVITEIRVTENSPLAHKTVEEIETQFGVKILTVSTPFPSPAEQKKPSNGFKLYPNLYVEIQGDYNNIRNLRLHAVKY